MFSHGKRLGPSFIRTEIHFERMLSARFIRHWPMVMQKKIFEFHHKSLKNQINAYYRHQSAFTVHLIQICEYNLEYHIKNVTAVTKG